MVGPDDKVEAGVGVGAEVEMVEAGVEMVEVGMIGTIERLPLLPPSSRLLPPCRASVTTSAVSCLCFGGVASR